MSISYGFYNSLNHDRAYNAEQMGSIFDGIIKDGIFDSIGNMFVVKNATDMQISVGTGKGWAKGTWTINDALYPLDIESSHAVLNRIDAVVWEINKNTRINSFKVVRGTDASVPEKPELINDEILRIYQIPLAYITVKAGVKEITIEDIENRVGMEDCPFVTGVIQTADISDLYLQWEASFMKWFDKMKGQLDEDAAGHLQNEINDINEVFKGTVAYEHSEITFRSSRFHSDSIISIYTSEYGVGPEKVIVDEGECTLQFDSPDNPIEVAVKIEG